MKLESIDGVHWIHGFCIALPGHGTCQAMELAPWERAGFILRMLTSWGDDPQSPSISSILQGVAS